MKLAPFSVSYPGFTLHMPDFTLEQGRLYALIGANGSGKSSLLKAIAGVYPVSPPPLDRLITVSYLPQKPHLFRMSVLQNILLGEKDEKKAAELMQALDIAHLAKKNARRLSGGESAKTALSRSLMRRCDLLLLDEPTAAMDMESTLLAESVIRQTGQNCCTLLVTHSPAQAQRLADYVLFFSKGELREWGTAADILNDPKEPETKRFLAFAK